MARDSRRHRRSPKMRRPKMRGGSYTDGASYGMYVNGTGGSQWTRTMDQGGAYGQVPGNVIIGAQGQNVSPALKMPSGNNLNLVQSAGRKYRRGGFIGEVINQAVVPFALLGAQQSYGRKRKGGKTHKKRGGFIGEVVNQAAVPFTLFATQQSYARKRKGDKTRRHRRQ